MAKFKVEEIVLHKDGQYECEVVEVLVDDENPKYKLIDCAHGTTFEEFEFELIGEDEE